MQKHTYMNVNDKQTVRNWLSRNVTNQECGVRSEMVRICFWIDKDSS